MRGANRRNQYEVLLVLRPNCRVADGGPCITAPMAM